MTRIRYSETITSQESSASGDAYGQDDQTGIDEGLISITSDEEELLSSLDKDLETNACDEFKMRKLATYPRKGSVIQVLSAPRVTHSMMASYMTDYYIKRLMMVVIDDSLSLPSYVVYSFVLPHKEAVDIAETISSQSGCFDDEMMLLSVYTGFDLKTRGDILNMMRVVLRRHPSVMDFFLPRVTKIVNKG